MTFGCKLDQLPEVQRGGVLGGVNLRRLLLG